MLTLETTYRNESQRGSDPIICKTFLNLSPRAFALSEARQAPLFAAEKKQKRRNKRNNLTSVINLRDRM